MRTTAGATASPEADLEAIGRELDAIRERVVSDLGEETSTYLRRVIRWQRGLAAAGRASLFLGFIPPFWIGGARASASARSSTTWRSATT